MRAANQDLYRRPRLRRLRRRTSPPSWLVGALRRLRALALAPSLASDYSSTQRAAVSTTSCAARSSSAGARQVEERVRSHPRRAVRRPGWLPVAPAAGRSASAVRPELRGLTAPRSPRSSTSRWSRSTQGASPAHRTRPLRAPPLTDPRFLSRCGLFVRPASFLSEGTQSVDSFLEHPEHSHGAPVARSDRCWCVRHRLICA